MHPLLCFSVFVILSLEDKKLDSVVCKVFCDVYLQIFGGSVKEYLTLLGANMFLLCVNASFIYMLYNHFQMKHVDI